MTSLPFLMLLICWLFPASIAALLLLFHRTHVVTEYGSKLGLGKFLKVEQFKAWELKNRDVGYPIFLEETHSTFFTRLLRCPWCFGWWLSLIATFFIRLFICSFEGNFMGVTLFYLAITFSISYLSFVLYFLGTYVYRLVFPSSN